MSNAKPKHDADAIIARYSSRVNDLIREIVTGAKAQPDKSKALYQEIREMISTSPQPFAAIKLRTRAPDNAIKSVLIRLQRDLRTVDGKALCINMGTQRRALWAIVTEDFLDRLRAK